MDVLSARKIAKFLKKEKIDIVHAHLARDYPPASLAIRLFPKTKLILARHVLFPLKHIHKLVLNNVSRVIAVSSAVEANLQKTFPKEKITCVPNGIEIKKWTDVDQGALFKEFRFEHNISFDAPLIGTVGELKKLKGQEDFILAANEIVKKFPEAHFVIVGKDNSFDQTFRRTLRRLVKVLGLAKRFLFLDWIEDTAPLLSALDVFVSASHSESFGLAILEAMASGKGIISTETDGAKELLIDDQTGLLSPIKSPVKLAENICKLLEDKNQKKILGANAKKIAVENYGVEKMVSSIEEIYIQTLAQD